MHLNCLKSVYSQDRMSSDFKNYMSLELTALSSLHSAAGHTDRAVTGGFLPVLPFLVHGHHGDTSPDLWYFVLPTAEVKNFNELHNGFVAEVSQPLVTDAV